MTGGTAAPDEPRDGAPEPVPSRAERLLALQHRLMLALGGVTDLGEGLRLTLDAAIEASEMDSGGIYLLDESTGDYELRCHAGVGTAFVEAVRRFGADSGQARVVAAGEPAYFTTDGVLPVETGPWMDEGLRFVAAIPLRHEGRVIGCLNVASHLAAAPPWARTTLETVGAQLGSVIARLRAEEELRGSEASFRRLSAELEARVEARTAQLTAALRSLQASEAMYRSLVDTTGAGYVIVDAEGRVLDANPKYLRIAGQGELDELRGRRLLEWIAAHDQKRGAEALARCLREGRLVELELDYVDRQGRTTRVEMNATVVEREGAPRILALCRDISVRRQAETALIEAQVELLRREKLAVLGQLSGSVAHELRNPLGVIKNAAYFLGTIVPGGDPRVKEYLDIIASEVHTSQRIISDLLDFSRTRVPCAQPVAVADLVRESLARCAVPVDVEVVVDVPESLPPVSVDPLQIRQVFQNLLANAIQAMPHGGRLAVRAAPSAEAGTIEVAVADTGEGIPPEHLDKLFQPLFTTRPRGIGLGLALVKRNVEANGGTVSVASRPARGSTFTLRLPAAQQGG